MMPDRKRNRLFVVAMLLLLALVPYSQVLRHDFVSFDDGLYVAENPVVLQGLTLEGLAWGFSTFEGGNWHPVTWFSHMLAVTLWGRWAGGHHLMNVLLHAINTLILFGVMARMTGATWRSALVAALFAVHPVHVESVAWISERKDVLSVFFGLLAIVVYVRYAETLARKRYAAVMVLMALSLMSKPMVVTLPFALLLFDYWPLGRLNGWGKAVGRPGLMIPDWQPRPVINLRRAVLEKTPMLLISGVFCVVAMISQRAGQTISSLESLPLAARLANAAVSYGTYLHKLFVPMNLAVFYPHPGQWEGGVVLMHAVIVIVITVVAIVQWRTRPWWAVGWLFFLGTLVPVIGLVQIGLQSMADRYMYLPAIGIYIVVAWSIPWPESRAWRGGVAIAAAGVLAALAATTHMQASHWRDSRALYLHAIRVTQRNYLAHQNYGSVFERDRDYPAALEQYELAASFHPGHAKTWVDMANVLLQMGRIPEALERAEVAIQLDDRLAVAHNTRGVLLLVREQPVEAAAALRRAVELDPDNMEARGNCGAALLTLQQWDEAILHLSAVKQAHPERVGVRTNLAKALAGAGRKNEAIAELQEVMRTAPQYAPAKAAWQELTASR